MGPQGASGGPQGVKILLRSKVCKNAYQIISTFNGEYGKHVFEASGALRSPQGAFRGPQGVKILLRRRRRIHEQYRITSQHQTTASNSREEEGEDAEEEEEEEEEEEDDDEDD